MDLKDINVARWSQALAPVDAAGDDVASVAARLAAPIKRFKFLTADGQSATPLEQEALLGVNDLVEFSFLLRCGLVADCIGRVRIQRPGERGWATGFLIAPGLMITNHHVFPDAVSANGASIEFGYWNDVAGQTSRSTDEFALAPGVFYVSDPDLDFAVVAVAETSASGAAIVARGYLRMIPESGKVTTNDYVTILQHPEGAPMQIALRENQVTRVEPGEPFIWYRADTAHGSSGAPVFNDSLQLVALHSSGRIRRDAQGRYARTDGTWVARLDGLTEADVLWEANIGFRVSRICASMLSQAQANWPEHVDVLQAAMRGGDVLARAVERLKTTGPSARATPAAFPSLEHETMANPTDVSIGAATGVLTIPLQLRISLEAGDAWPQGRVAAVSSPPPGGVLEAEAFQLRMPVIYDGLGDRAGFDRDFLDLANGAALPMPKLTAAGQAAAAPLLDGGGLELTYRHFSVWMQRERRLAMLTAANVDWRARQKKVDGQATDRDSLAGFPPKSTFGELWAPETRIAARHQLPDTFYTEDRGAFDKGHIVRRDDVCWGETFEEIQMANGDTFHVTNCSPQIKAFNQGAAGQENWGDLESYIQATTKREVERACIFAGPIFGAADRWFAGKDDSSAVRVQIPSRFWKLVVVKGAGGVEAYGFILEQDVRAITETEFFVTPEWIGAMHPVADIQALLRGWVSLEDLVAHDMFDSVHSA